MVRAPKLPIPAEALLDCGAILGKRGSGKSSLARSLLEHELDLKHRACFVDPMGDAAGILFNPDLTHSRFKDIIVFGGGENMIKISGKEGSKDGGKVGRIVGSSDKSFLIDLSHMGVTEQLRFMTQFADALFDNMILPLILFIDEAHVFAPQQRGEASAMLLNRMATLNSQGRKKGIFLWLMTQRPARINKNVLGGTETLIAMKVLMPQDREPIAEWFESHGPEAQKEVLTGLGKLNKGEAFVYASGQEFYARVQFPMHSTLDTGKTPKHGEAIGGFQIPKTDISQLAAEFADMATGDPRDDEIKRLTTRNAELERERGNMRTARDQAVLRADALSDVIIRVQDAIGMTFGSPRYHPAPADVHPDDIIMAVGTDGEVRPVYREGMRVERVMAGRRQMRSTIVPETIAAPRKGAK